MHSYAILQLKSVIIEKEKFQNQYVPNVRNMYMNGNIMPQTPFLFFFFFEAKQYSRYLEPSLGNSSGKVRLAIVY
jgi:hypothetical protein